MRPSTNYHFLSSRLQIQTRQPTSCVIQNNINGGDRPNQRQQVRCVDTERLPCRVKSELNCFEHYNRHHTTENVACQKTNAQFQEGENAVTQNNINGGDQPNQRQQVRCEPSPCHPQNNTPWCVTQITNHSSIQNA